jgi:hypothetical protein
MGTMSEPFADVATAIRKHHVGRGDDCGVEIDFGALGR